VKKKVIYIAGAVRAPTARQVEMNVRRAEELCFEVWKTGKAAAICPHSNERYFFGELDIETILSGDLEILRRCDAILLVPGHENSKGTQGEIKFSFENGIPVFSHLEDLIEWIESCENKEIEADRAEAARILETIQHE
jgi:thiamine pyrophosphate-dependent acetolactate synthase large subunit-like protein